MTQVMSSLTVLFEEPFWRGIYEWEEEGHYKVMKITFGSEPKINEVYEFILTNWNRLTPQDVKTVAASESKKSSNPKRMQRIAKKQMQGKGIGTKAQQALKEQQEQGKLERKAVSKAQKEAEKAMKFELRQEKRKQKHRGH